MTSFKPVAAFALGSLLRFPGRSARTGITYTCLCGLLALFCMAASTSSAAAQNTGTLPSVSAVDSLKSASWALRNTVPEEAVRLARMGVAMAREIGYEKGMAMNLQCMAAAHRTLGRSDSAKVELQEALSICERTEDWPGVIGCCQKLAGLYTGQGEVSNALEVLQRAEDLAKKGGTEEELARTLNLKGAALQVAGRYEEAIRPYFESINIRKRTGSDALANSYVDLGGLYLDMGRNKEAEELYGNMVTDARKANDPAMLAKGYLNYSAVMNAEGRHRELKQYADSALTAFLANKDKPGATKAYLNRSLAEQHLGDLSSARQDLDSAIAGYRAIGNQGGLAKACQNMASLLLMQQDAKGALAWCDEGLSIARANGLRAERSSLLKTKGEALRALGRLDEALAVMRSYVQLKDSLIGERTTQQLASAEMKEKYDAVERIAELEQMKVARDEEQALKEERTRERDLLLIAAAVLVLLLVLLVRNLRNRRKLAVQERQLNEKRITELLHQNEVQVLNAMMQGQDEERKRVAKDLHDRLGSMLSAIKHQFSAMEGRMVSLHQVQGEQYQKVCGLLDEAVGEVRRISHNMVQGALVDSGLPKALQDLRESIQMKGRLEVELVLFGLEKRMERATEIGVYRIVQELVANALKHARPTELSIALTRGGNSLSIIVSDNGTGFDPNELNDGIGMENVRSRVEQLNGSLQIDSSPGNGSTFSIEVPIPA